MQKVQKLVVIGAGVMGEALIGGILQAKRFAPADVTVTDARVERLNTLGARYGIGTTDNNTAAAGVADLVIIAVKPHVVASVLAEISPALRPGSIVVSIAAGIGIATLEGGLPDRVTVVRAMPNSPCRVGAGAVALSPGRGVTEESKAFLTKVLTSIGRVVWVGEEMLDAVTGLSGSGPAYVFAMMEALADGAVCAGLPRDIAHQLAAQTILGAAEMVLTTNTHPAVLREQVCTPGGTTIAGLYALEKGAFRATVMSAVEAATQRSRELAQRLSGKER